MKMTFASHWRRFLHSPYAALLTHGALVVLTMSFFAMLWFWPFWLAFVPSVIVGHRVGVLLHEYMHGIPFRTYRANLRVVTFWDGLLLFFGLLELFRGTHLAHHKWLNTERDPAFDSEESWSSRRRGLAQLISLEVVQYLRYLYQAFSGRHPYVRPRRIVLGSVLSMAWIAFWVQIGRSDIAFKVLAVSLYTVAVPATFRGAVEHHSYEGDPGFSNEYKVLIPLFNLNKHIHHHEEPDRPWYLLAYRTPRPLTTWHYFTHWFRVLVKRDYALMQPMPSERRRTKGDSAS